MHLYGKKNYIWTVDEYADNQLKSAVALDEVPELRWQNE